MPRHFLIWNYRFRRSLELNEKIYKFLEEILKVLPLYISEGAINYLFCRTQKMSSPYSNYLLLFYLGKIKTGLVTCFKRQLLIGKRRSWRVAPDCKSGSFWMNRFKSYLPHLLYITPVQMLE